MQIRQIDDGVAVAGQIDASDVPAIANSGFRTLISNRPDNENGAVPHDEIRVAAEKAGLAFHYIPVISGALTEANVNDMAEAIRGAERPILAYCRSGGRCIALYNLVAAKSPR